MRVRLEFIILDQWLHCSVPFVDAPSLARLSRRPHAVIAVMFTTRLTDYRDQQMRTSTYIVSIISEHSKGGIMSSLICCAHLMEAIKCAALGIS